MIGRSGSVARVGLRLACATTFLTVVGAGAALSQVVSIERVGVGADGIQPNAPSSGPVCSNAGECVAFYSDATNLLARGTAGDSNGYTDVYLVDSSGRASRLSETEDGQSADGPSMAQRFRPSIDDSCTCVSFSTDATNLVPNDTNGRTDVVLRVLSDPPSNELMSVGLDGNSANGRSSYSSVSGDCGRVAFSSTASNLVEGDGNKVSDIFVHDRSSGTVSRVSAPSGGEADGPSITPSISGDGNCVAFASLATNLAEDDSNGVYDIYVACNGEITCRASVSSDGEQANAISFHPSLNQDGSIVAFKSEASNLVARDLNGQPDVFVHDCISGITERVSVSTLGAEANDIAIPPSISRDGNRVAFGSYASNLADSIHTNGRSQIYVRDRMAGQTVLISANDEGEAQNGSSPDLPPSICPDGDFVAFASSATNLEEGDTNGYQDIFVISVGPEPTPGPTSTPTPEPIPCDMDTDCDPGTVCGDDGFCVPAPTPTPTISCDEDMDCPMGLVCLDDVCTDPSTPTPTPTPLPTCLVDEDCECPDGTPVEECDRCRANVCVPPRPCEDNTADLDCRGERETCVEGFCECGGDCNLNGLTFGTEISTMMCILGGACTEDQCITADVNEDGEVTGCDVTLAVLNLGLGCPGEGTPLVFGAQRTSETRTVSIGSATAARGQVIEIDISLEGGGEVSSAHTDILINTDDVEVEVNVDEVTAAIRPDCRLADALVGTFDDSAIRLPQVPRNPDGVRRIRVAAIDTTLPFPLDTFGEGPFIHCRFHVDAGATPGSVIPLMGVPERTEVGDFAAQPFTAVVADGAITVLDVPIECMEDIDCPEGLMCRNQQCVPETECEGPEQCEDRQACVPDDEMSGLSTCECVGDCNLDGRVRNNEITAMINIINGVADVTTCLAADQDGDGRVRANDVTLAIININQGCPGQLPVAP